VPNQALQQTGHAKDGSARHSGFSRVSRLLSWLFGLLRTRIAMKCESLAGRLRGLHPATVGLVLAAVATLGWLNWRIPSTVREINLGPGKAVPIELDPVTASLFFRGWPISPFEVCVFHGMKYHPEVSSVRFVLVLDFTVAGLILFGIGVLSESLSRRRGLWRGK